MRVIFRPASLAATLILPLLAGCATPPPANDPDAVEEFKQTNDPLEPTNRVIYAVNDAVDTVVLRPIAVAYRDGLPQQARTRVHLVLENLSNPVVLANDMMQGKPRRAGDTLMRLLLNSTLGVAGIFDVATDWGWPQHDSDFGITLASWGADAGPYLFLPLFGPSNPRDGIGIGADIVLDPFTWVGAGSTVDALGYSRTFMNAVDARAGALDDLDKIKAQALDPYATIRSLFRQYRANKVATALADDRATPPNWYAQPSR
jgi:phospholipid-binding lipoprotein MlaA